MTGPAASESAAFPLGPGGSIDQWLLSPTAAEPFDIPDESMAGVMDAGFFLADTRNFIPHEYPCRRVFAARHRDRKPEPRTVFAQASGADGWWIPVDGDRVDLSGFWHRPAFVQAWARTTLRIARAGRLRFRIATCGAALLRIDGRDVHWLAPYRRNLGSEADCTAELSAGDHMVEVWFADLCERDTRWWFRLALIDGPPAQVVLPVPIPARRVRAMLAVRTGLRFDHPAYSGGTVALALDPPAEHLLDVHLHFASDYQITVERQVTATLTAGATALPVLAASALKPDFHRCTVTLRDGPFALHQRLDIEVINTEAAGPAAAPATLSARVAEALAHACATRNDDPATVLARLECGVADDRAAPSLPLLATPVRECIDCADFILVPLLWIRMRHGDRLDAVTRHVLDDAILGFRYWLDEPGNDVMWFFSENHALLLHACAHLAGSLLPDATFARSGRSGRAQQAVGRERLLRWFDHFEACELMEWNAAPYIPIDLKGLCALFVLSPEPTIRARSRRAILRLLEVLALASHQGLHVASQGRSYEHSLRPARTLELSGIARMLWGRGWYGLQMHALPLLALAIRDPGLVVPPALGRIARWQDDRALEWCFAQGEAGVARLYHCKTRHWAMGSVAGYRAGKWGYQETVLHARIGDHPDAQIWINHPGERIVSGFGRPSYWGGCATLPRVHQYKGLALLRFDGHADTPDFTHAHVAEIAYDEVVHDGHRLLLRCGDGLALIQASRPLERIARGATAGIEVRQAGRKADWLVRLSDLGTEGSLAAFAARMRALAVTTLDGATIRIDDPDHGSVACAPDGIVRAEGRMLDPSTWTLAGEARLSDGTLLPLPSHGHGKGGAR